MLSHSNYNAYLTQNFTVYLFYESLSDWAEYGLLGHRSMRSPTDQWPRIADGCLIDFSCN